MSYYSVSYYNPDQYKHLTYANASPEKRYIKILKFYYDNGEADRFSAVTSVFKDSPVVYNAWLKDKPRHELRGYAVTYFGQLVNDGLLSAKKSGRSTLFSLTDTGEQLLKTCGAI